MTNPAIVFVGPSLRPQDLLERGQRFSWHAPVQQGDVYRALARRPCAIGIIDGFFNGAPSVWHKEILFALDQGVPVYGSASMGALRAAELADFGMRGVGRIFADYRSGLCEDDDEVALTHAPGELGWQPLSEPMVNVRASLARALAEGIITAQECDRLTAVAKSQFFAGRTWDSILAAGDRTQGTARLRDWLAEHLVDQKRLDALAMLDAMEAKEAFATQEFRFEWTHHFANLADRIDLEASQTLGASGGSARELVEELRLEGLAAYEVLRGRALLRYLAGRSAERRRSNEIGRQAKQQVLQELRERLGLTTQQMLIEWARENDLDEAGLDRLLSDEARRKETLRLASGILDALLVEELKLSGRYAKLRARAQHKRAKLRDLVLASDSKSLRPPPPMLREWYFKQQLGQQQPKSIDAYRLAVGFADLSEFDSALAREWLFCRWSDRHEAETGS